MVHLDEGTTFLSHDLQLLESLEFKQRIKHIVEIVEEVKWEDVDPDMLTRFIFFLVFTAFLDNFPSKERKENALHKMTPKICG